MSSRLIVKGLPKYLTEERFKKHFSGKGDVTDCRLMKTPTGVSRRFGYIGYKTVEDAQAALKHFNKSFIDTAKIHVEEARAANDPSLPRAWSSYTAGSSAHALKNGVSQTTDAQSTSEKEAEIAAKKSKRDKFLKDLCEEDESEKLQEYLEVMQPRIKTKTWANDDGNAAATARSRDTEKSNDKEEIVPKGDSDDEYEDLPATKNAASVAEPAPEVDDSETKAVANNQELSDMDYLKLKMKNSKSLLLGEDGEDDETGEANVDEDIVSHNEPFVHPSRMTDDMKRSAAKSNATETTKKTTTEPSTSSKPSDAETASANANVHASRLSLINTVEQDPISQLSDTGRLFLRNLPFSTTEDDLRQTFELFGPLSEVHMPIDRTTKAPKGVAYILFLIPEHAVKAYKEVDKTIYQGRLIHILPAMEKPNATPAPEEGSLTLKKKREIKRKGASGNDFNWNSLFMSQDAIAASIAERLNVEKSEVLDPSADNAAVRLALAETQIIAETKKFLEEHGIRITAFGKMKRSDTVILVKNTPFGTTEGELTDLFGKFGDLGRILIPPAKTMAVVEFLHPTEARSAFSSLAYKRFKNTILYLEKAPVDVFTTAYDPTTMKSSASSSSSSPSSTPAATATDSSSSAVHDGTTVKSSLFATTSSSSDHPTTSPVAGGTLFVKNLSFSTRDEGLRNLFSTLAGFRSAKVSTKPHPRDPTLARQSMGFGFLEFDSSENALAAVEALQGANLDGHKLLLKVSDRGGNRDEEAGKGGKKKAKADDFTETKLVVRNVPFEATKKDIKELFGSFGHLKSARLPSKMGGGHRGFAFVEYLTPREAAHAMESVGAAHLYGRHLVIEPAKEDDDEIEAVRERTGKRFVREDQEGGVAGKKAKRKKVLEEGDEGDFLDRE